MHFKIANKKAYDLYAIAFYEVENHRSIQKVSPQAMELFEAVDLWPMHVLKGNVKRIQIPYPCS